MKMNFRIDWGYQYLYSRRLYHPQYVWDGELDCENGEIKETYQLDYPIIWFGPGHTAKETKLEKPKWVSRTKRGLSGIRFVADVEANAVFHLHTVSGCVDFTAFDVEEKGRLEFPIGPKYLGCFIIVTKTDFYWFHQPMREGESALESWDLSLPVFDWARMKLAWLKPGETVSWKVQIPAQTHDLQDLLIHLVAMAAPEFSPEKETQVNGTIPMEFSVDGNLVHTSKRYYRHHDVYMQMLEDDWQRLPITEGEHTIGLRNCSAELCLAISRIITKVCTYDHGEVSVPEWMLLSEKLTGKVYAVKEDAVEVTVGDKKIALDCKSGWNEFDIAFSDAGKQSVRTFRDCKTIEVYDIPEEPVPVKVGYDMTVVPHDDSGDMDWLLDYTQRTRLANYVVFRSFTQPGPVSDELWQRWGEYCRTHNIWVSSCTEFMNGVLMKASGERFHDCGLHEYPGAVYACDPTEPWISKDMKEASESYQKFLKAEIDKVHDMGAEIAFGDASGGIRYSYLAGVDFVRAETMVGHTQALLSQARPAAEALGNGHWGVHIAIQHNFQPYHENHMGQYFLSLMQPWTMGAEVIYEEDSLFELFKEERQAWDDVCTKGKRNMTRAFYRFTKMHPRQGRNVRRIAFLEGRYAAPFNGFICDVEQDPHYAVWGKFGNPAPEWSHGQPEKCRAILDVLMPGACTHPFLQKFDKRRFFFSGTPYGDFDCVPAEADSSYWSKYALLLNLGWNTMIPEDYEKLKKYVEDGGIFLTGIPQFSTHKDREFLKNMNDLSLVNGGDLTELCGIRVKGRGSVWCGQWNCANRETILEPELSAMPSDSAEEDDAGYLADVDLCGAEIVAWDSFTAKPLLVRKKVGKGYLYTFTIWAYPGHEKFQRFAAAWTAKLADGAKGDIYAEDTTGEIFWTVWEDGADKYLMLLNTDWTVKGNVKPAKITYVGGSKVVDVPERAVVIAKIAGGKTDVKTYAL